MQVSVCTLYVNVRLHVLLAARLRLSDYVCRGYPFSRFNSRESLGIRIDFNASQKLPNHAHASACFSRAPTSLTLALINA